MAVLVGEAVDLVLDAGAVARPNPLDHPREERGAVEVVADAQAVERRLQALHDLGENRPAGLDRAAHVAAREARDAQRKLEQENGRLMDERDQLKASVTNWPRATFTRCSSGLLSAPGESST